VAPTRRNYLSPADVRGLPLGVWVESGPYTRSEWLARGVAGAAGRAAHLRVNDRSYLAVYEARSGAMWRLETTGKGAHHGLVADGTADSFADAKVAVRVALTERFPDAARAVDGGVSAPVAPQHGWVRLPGGRDDRTEGRVFDERVTVMVSPGPGGRWQPWVTVDGASTQGPLTASAADAREVADAMARGQLMILAAATPDRANRMIAELTEAGSLTRDDLDRIVGTRLTDVDRMALRSPELPPGELVDLLSATGVVGPATVVAVLHHQGVDADTVAGLIPAIGLPVPDAIRELHHRWGMDRLDAGAHLAATPAELQQAGCTTVEMLRAAPREILRRLDTREHTWEVAAHTLEIAGYPTGDVIRQLAAHAPTPETFAAGVNAIETDPTVAFATAARNATVADLVALSERYGMSPTATADVLVTACAPPAVTAAVTLERCDGDTAAAVEACRAVMDPDMTYRALAGEPVVAELTALRADGDATEIDEYALLREALGGPVSDTRGLSPSTDEGLRAALNAPSTGTAGLEVDRDGRE